MLEDYTEATERSLMSGGDDAQGFPLSYVSIPFSRLDSETFVATSGYNTFLAVRYWCEENG